MDAVSYTHLDVYKRQHNGYVYREDPIYHRRRVLHLAQDVYVIDDQVTGLGLSEHDLRLYFNFAFGHLTDKGGGNFSYESQKGRQYDFISEATSPVEYEILEGSEEPIGGWISYGYAWKKPIPQLAVKAKGPVPIRFLTVIKPESVQVVTKTELGTITVKLENGMELLLEEDKVIVKEGGKKA